MQPSAGLMLLMFLSLPLFAGVALMISGRRTRAGGEAGPHCGKCRYNLTGATGNRCPECGSLFIEAGVVIQGIRRRQRRFYAGLALCLLTLVLVGPASFSILLARQARAQAQSAQAAAAAQRAALQQVAAFQQQMLRQTGPKQQWPTTAAFGAFSDLVNRMGRRASEESQNENGLDASTVEMETASQPPREPE